jgi:protein SDA1
LRIKEAAKQVESGGSSAQKRKLAELQGAKKASRAGEPDSMFLSETDLMGPRKKMKATYDERIASIQEGREGREKFGSKKGKQRRETPTSSTNKEKRKNKPIMMVIASQGVKSKKKLSLSDKHRKIRKHIDTAKKAYK